LPGGGGGGGCGDGRGSGLDMAEVTSTMEARAHGRRVDRVDARLAHV